MADVENIEVTVNVDTTCTDALLELALNFYNKTGVRLQRVDFDWTEQQVLGHPLEHYLDDVTVTYARSAK